MTVTMVVTMLLGQAGVTLAQETAKYGYVDMRKLMLESKAGQRGKSEIERLVKQKQEQIAKEEQKIKDLRQAADKDQLVFTEAQKRAKQREIQQKTEDLQQLAKDAQREVAKKDNEFSSKAIAEIRALIAEIAKEEKLSLVFEKNEMPVLYATEGPDLTDKVLKKYDAKTK